MLPFIGRGARRGFCKIDVPRLQSRADRINAARLRLQNLRLAGSIPDDPSRLCARRDRASSYRRLEKLSFRLSPMQRIRDRLYVNILTETEVPPLVKFVSRAALTESNINATETQMHA